MATALLLTAAASADQVKNNIVADAGGNKIAAAEAGGSVPVNFKVDQEPVGTDGQSGCNAADGTPAKLGFSGLPAGTTYSPNPFAIPNCTGFHTVTFAVPAGTASGDYPVTVSVADSGTGGYGTANAAFTLRVTPPPAPPDATGPSITPHVVGSLGLGGWYVSDVQLSWSVLDEESAISSQSGCETVMLTANQAATNYTCSATSAGGSSQQSITIKIDKNGPQVSGGPTTSANGAGWYKGNVEIDWACSDSPAGLAAGCPANSVVSGEGRGLTASSGDVFDNAGNFTNTVSSPAVDIDRNGPNVNGSVTSAVAYTDGATNKWYKDSASVDWSASDPTLADGSAGSGIASGPNPSSSNFGEGFGQSASASATDVAGNAGNGSVAGVNVDASGPNVAAAIASTPAYTDGSGQKWYKDGVSISVTASDPTLSDGHGGSGLKTDPSGTVARNVSGSFSASAEDNVGHVAQSNEVSYLIDGSNPVVQFTSCPTSAVLKGSSASASWTASDTGSGLATPAGGSVALDTSSVGSKTVHVSASDNVGHSGGAACSYSVVYDWSGFFQPIDNKDANGNYVLNKAKAGSTIPVKFSLGGDQGLSILVAGSPSSGSIACTSAATSDAIEEYSTATVSGLKYDALAGQYIYNWKTDSSWAGKCRQLVVKLVDGTEHRANFSFFK